MANYKRIFLNGYSYYITIVTHQRNPILINNIELLRESFKYTKSLFTFQIEAIVVMPDHIHMILHVNNAKDYPKIISSLKRHFSKNCDPKFYEEIFQSHHREKVGYKPIWQKRFYEHTIRDDKDYNAKLQYIYNNPVKHGYVEKINDWKYCSLNFKFS